MISYLVTLLQVKQVRVILLPKKLRTSDDGSRALAQLCIQALVNRLFYVCFKMGGAVFK